MEHRSDIAATYHGRNHRIRVSLRTIQRVVRRWGSVIRRGNLRRRVPIPVRYSEIGTVDQASEDSFMEVNEASMPGKKIPGVVYIPAASAVRRVDNPLRVDAPRMISRKPGQLLVGGPQQRDFFAAQS